MFNLFFHFGKSKTSLNWKNFLNWTCLNQKTTVIQYSKIYLYLTVFVGFLMMSQMMHGRKIPGIIKKINKALFGKVIYSKYYKLSNKSSRFFLDNLAIRAVLKFSSISIKIPCYWIVSNHIFRCNLWSSIKSWLKWNWDICYFNINPHWHEQ